MGAYPFSGLNLSLGKFEARTSKSETNQKSNDECVKSSLSLFSSFRNSKLFRVSIRASDCLISYICKFTVRPVRSQLNDVVRNLFQLTFLVINGVMVHPAAMHSDHAWKGTIPRSPWAPTIRDFLTWKTSPVTGSLRRARGHNHDGCIRSSSLPRIACSWSVNTARQPGGFN